MMRTHSQQPAIIITGLVIVIDAIWLMFSKLNFATGNWVLLTGLSLIFILFYQLHKQHRFSVRIYHLLLNTILLVCFSLAGFILSYLVVSETTQHYDQWLVQTDAALGFDWLSYNAFFLQNAYLRSFVLVFYLLVPVLPLLIIGKFIMLEQFESAAQCVLLIILSSLACLGVAAVIPSVGAAAYYQPDADFYRGFNILIDRDYMQSVAALYSGEPVTIRLWQPMAVIAFPSFHAALATIAVLCSLKLKIWFQWGLVLNIAGLLAIPVEGGHHLVDVIAGILITGFIYTILNTTQRNRPVSR